MIISASLFQFHSGSIKTYVETGRLVIAILFQFHSGSIKTKPPKPKIPDPEIRFNSTLVRLKLIEQ